MPGVMKIRQEEVRLAGIRFILHSRTQLQPILDDLTAHVPSELVTGPPMLILHYVSSAEEGTLAEMGLPVSGPFETGHVTGITLPGSRCLSVTHRGPISGLGEAYRALFGYAEQAGIVSDEYGVEVLWDIADLQVSTVEARLVIHPWEDLFRENLRRVLGEPAAGLIFGDCGYLTEETPLKQRFEHVKEAVGRLEEAAGEFQRYDCLSGCAHVFPTEQVDKLRAVFAKAREEGHSTLESVDRVIAFMDTDKGWSEKATREGNVILTSKGPRDRNGYEQAITPEEKAEAACFCPIIRKKLDGGMPRSFCYCGAGWYRQQWEGATGMPVRVEILGSLLNGDPECRFAVHLPDAP